MGLGKSYRNNRIRNPRKVGFLRGRKIAWYAPEHLSKLNTKHAQLSGAFCRATRRSSSIANGGLGLREVIRVLPK